jgi:hypothetical protein
MAIDYEKDTVFSIDSISWCWNQFTVLKKKKKFAYIAGVPMYCDVLNKKVRSS